MNEETLFHLAREKSPGERLAFLDAACLGDAAKRERVEALLRADEGAGSFLARPAVECAAAAGIAATLAPDDTVSAGRPPVDRIRYFGDYELLEEIAQGGMGVVWKARQANLRRDVALKMIRAGALASPSEVARFHREAEAAANLQHPNIVAIHEVGEHQGLHYFSMDLVEGRDLGAIAAEGPMPPQRAARYVKIIAEAIHFAHQRGTLHRDLKPQNILIDDADQPQITDFGLAKTASDSQLTQSGVIMGSPSYMPPEQAAGRIGDIGPASDVYSLGAMLYELLTGRPPFRGETAMATLHDVMETEPAALRKLKADVPPDLETICLKCLEKSPAARYTSARALAEELDRFLKGEPILARPASTVRKVVNWCRRHPGALAAVAALVIVSLAFGTYYLLQENAFLRSQQADPALARIPGWRHEALKTWGDAIAIWLGLLGVFALIAVNRRSRGMPLNPRISFKRKEREPYYLRPLQPLGDWGRTFAIVAGIIEIAGGFAYLVALIQARVWEGEPVRPGQFAILYLLVYWGYAVLHMVVRDYRLVNYGVAATPGVTITSGGATPGPDAASRAAYEKARAAMETWDQQAAIQVYRDAGLAKPDAMVAVMHIGKKLRAERPDRFAYPPLSPADMSWRGMLICALIEAANLGAAWCGYPPSHPIAAVLTFAYSFLLGMGIMAFARVKGFGKRMLLLVPGLVVMLVSEMALHSIEGPSRTFEPYILGYFFGTVLMACGLVGEAGRALRRKLSQSGGEQP